MRQRPKACGSIGNAALTRSLEPCSSSLLATWRVAMQKVEGSSPFIRFFLLFGVKPFVTRAGSVDRASLVGHRLREVGK
jgi:hypothetical protein